MFPTICKIGPVTIQSYGLMLAVAAVVCGLLLARDAARSGIAKDIIFDLMFWIVLCGIAGARVFFVILNWGYFIEYPVEIVMIQNGGLAWQGGLLAGGLTAWRFMRLKQLRPWMMLDLMAPYIALGQSIGRIGCFLTGCCYGRPVSWGLYAPIQDDHLHPTQLYAVGALFMVFGILKIYQKRPRREGQVFALYLILAAAQRFVIEFFRGDHMHTLLGLSVYQWVTIGIAVTGAALYRRVSRST